MAITQSSLSRRLILYIVLSSSAITLFLTAFQLYWDYQANVKVIDAGFQQIKTVYQKSIELTVWSTDKDKLQVLLNGLTNLPDIEYVSVDDGDSVISVGRITSENIVSRSYKLTHTHLGETLDIGILRVVANLDSVFSRVFDRAIVILLSNAIKTTLVAGIMLLIIHQVVIRHLMTITKHVGDFQLGESQRPLSLNRKKNPSGKNDELDSVVHSINEAAKRVAETFLKVQTAEERTRDFTEASSDWFWEMDSNLRFTFLSPRFFELFPVKPDNILGKTREEFTGVARRDESWSKHFSDLDNRKPFRDFEYSVKAPDGGIRHLRTSGKPLFDADNTFVGYRGTGTDITRRVRTEKALDESQRSLRAVIDTVPAMVNAKDKEGRYIIMNRYQAELYGTTPENAVGKTASELVGAEHGAHTAVIDSEVFSTCQAKSNYEEDWIDLKGVSHTLLTTKVPLRDNSGDVVGIVTVAVDITERKKAEEAMQKSEARLAGILDIAPEAVITVGADMKIQLFNKGAERVFGYTGKEMLGQSLEILMPEYFRNRHRSLVEDFARSGDTYRLMDRRQEILGLKKDGTEFPASASVSKLETGGETIFTVMLVDITERKQTQDILKAAKEEAEKANRSKSEFLAAMSHDLRTPLNAILGFADIISQQYFGPVGEKYQEYANDIHVSGELLLSLVNDLLDLSVIESGKKPLDKVFISIPDVVAECNRAVEKKATSLGIDLVTQASKDLPSLYADRRAIMQILLNLLSNAVKFTPEGGRITLKGTATNRHHTLEVSDTGKGIPADRIATLTDPFVKGETNPHKTQEGTGLGLAIVKSLVDLHDGELSIRSTVGKGTTITVTLPNDVA